MSEQVKKPPQEQNKPMQRKQGPMMGGGGWRFAGAKPKNFKKSMLQLLTYLKPHIPIIIIAMLLAVCSVVFSIFGPKYIGILMEHILEGLIGGSIDFSYINKIAIMLTCFYFLAFGLGFVQNFLLTKVGGTTCKQLRTEISQKVNRLPLKYFDKNSFGDVLSRVTNDVDTIATTVNQSLGQMISSIASVLGMLTMMLTISPILTLVPVATAPLSMLFMTLVIKYSQKFFRKQQANMGLVNGHVEEIYSAHNIVRAFNAQKREHQKFMKLNTELYKSNWKSSFFQGIMMPIFGIIGNLGYIAVCVLGGYFVLNNMFGVSVAAIVSFMIYVRQFNQPVSQLATISTTLQQTAAAAERVFQFLNEEEQPKEVDTVPAPQEVKGNVQFKNVNFGYLPEKQIIFDFNMHALAGQKVAIVGPTGAGKTTIVNLLMRFYEPSSGQILIDGIASDKMARADVRKMFGMVLQDTWVFEGTILENIVFGTKNVSFEDVRAAAKAANIDHFITTLPDGYNTKLSGEESLSAGQKQLLNIARAMIQNAPMLILDEATSSVDTRTEILIQQAMDRLSKGRTCFVIAHRLSTIKNADTILVMKDGNVIEMGDHDQLLAQQGFYCELYNSQFSQD